MVDTNRTRVSTTYTMQTGPSPTLGELIDFVEHCVAEGTPREARVSVRVSNDQRDGYASFTVTRNNR